LDTIKTVLVPLLLLMLISLATTSFGEPSEQLENIIAVYLAYGQFLLVFNEKTIVQKEISIVDVINGVGTLINVLQYLILIYIAQSKITDSNGDACEIKMSKNVGGKCAWLYINNHIIISLFLGTLFYCIVW